MFRRDSRNDNLDIYMVELSESDVPAVENLHDGVPPARAFHSVRDQEVGQADRRRRCGCADRDGPGAGGAVLRGVSIQDRTAALKRTPQLGNSSTTYVSMPNSISAMVSSIMPLCRLTT